MRRLFTFTLLGLVAISCSCRGQLNSRSHTMTFQVGAQTQLDAADQRINQLKQELLQQGFREASVSFSNSKEHFVLEGSFGSLEDLRVTLWTAKQLENDKTEVGGGVEASLRDEQASREFDELYAKVRIAVTGRAE